jgi:hypothetical protein
MRTLFSLCSSMVIQKSVHNDSKQLELRIGVKRAMKVVIGVLNKENKVKQFKIVHLIKGENTDTFLNISMVQMEDYLVIMNCEKGSILYSSKIF